MTTSAVPPLGGEARSEPYLSIVIPVYNEEAVLPLLIARLRSCMDALPGGCEVRFVNDGSRDRSLEILQAESARDARLKVLDLSRNFGQPIAITAGLDSARGDAVVVMDADLQDPPELIPEMVRLYREGFDVVHARRRTRFGESPVKKISAHLFYLVMRVAAERAPETDVGEFRLVSREVVLALRRIGERHRLMRGLVSWVGFRQTTLDFERPPRAAGVTKYPFLSMLRLSWDAMTSFSVAPLRIATLLGTLALAIGVGYAVYAIHVGFVLGLGVPGWTSLVTLHIFFSAVVLLCLGVIGEYVGKIFEEVKARPLYFVRREIDHEVAPRPADPASAERGGPKREGMAEG